jgi:hypothetical protein
MTKKDLHSMSTKEMIHCESCGGYHTLEDSEIVVIKIIKGKACDMPKAETRNAPNWVDKPTQPVEVVVPPAPPIPVPPAPPKKKIIPPGLLSMMIDPSNPNFEAFGAKETRRV